MNLKELRLGNLVCDPTGHIVPINCINCPDTYYYLCYPILLTPEILEKCGFEYYESNDSYQLDSNLGFSLWSGSDIPRVVNVYYESDELGNSINSLHQLQNLYFALTGEELTVNL